METESKKAVIYCRVSTKEQVEMGNSLASQEKECKGYALKNGYKVAKVFIEKGESAKNANRTELGNLIDFCTNRKNIITAVIAYKVDRIARNIDDYRYIKVLLKRYGVEIKSTSEHFEDTPAGRFMENIIANVAQFDNDVRTERSMGGMRDAMREGRYVWIAPIGYSNQRVGGKSTIVPNEKAPIIRKTFEEVAKNEHSVDAIRKYMFKEGLCNKKGNLFTKSYLYKVLNNEVYTGCIIKFGEKHKGLFGPIVTDELFEQVQRVLKRRSRTGFIYQRENPDFPLRRFVFHPSGIKTTGYWAKGRHKKYPYYRFIGIRKSDVKKEALEECYKDFINQYSLSKVHITYLKEVLESTLNSTITKDLSEKVRLKRKISELTERETSLLRKNEKGIINDTILKRHLNIVEEEQIKLNAELLKLPDKEENLDELFQFAQEYLEHPGLVWEKISFKQKVKLQWFEFPQGVFYHNGKFRTKQIASIFKAKDIFLPRLSSSVHITGQNFEPYTSNKKMLIEHARQIIRGLRSLSKILKEDESKG